MARIIVACLVLGLMGAAATLLASQWPYISHLYATTTVGISPEAFKEGLGIYLLNNNQYSMLVWRKKFGGAGGLEEKDMMDAYRQATPVKKGVRFFSYGMDISKWPVVPPYSMAFCIARDAKTMEGIFPIRIKPIDQTTYELILPPQIDALAAGTINHLFWAINYQYSCAEGWVFRFQ